MSSSIQTTLERINELRRKALSDPDFVEVAKEHTKAIERETEAQSRNDKPTKKRNKAKSEKLSSLYAHLTERPMIY